jgi:hypothetical protein
VRKYELADVVRHLPTARCYQPRAALGDDFYKLQCYFLTHFVYMMSDWGAHPLPPALFAEELTFVLDNMVEVVTMKGGGHGGEYRDGVLTTGGSGEYTLGDPEIVSEFMQCLRIFQVHDTIGASCMLLGEAYLKLCHDHYGGKGQYVSADNPFYTRYHASYCASVALMAYPWDKKGACPRPSALKEPSSLWRRV